MFCSLGLTPDSVRAASDGPVVIRIPDVPNGTAVCWVESSLKRVFPNSEPGTGSSITLTSARNRQVSFQVCLRNQSSTALGVTCDTSGTAGVKTQIRRVGYVPMKHHTTDIPEENLDGVGHIPGLVPDPLFPENTTTVGPLESAAFWLTLRIDKEAAPGIRDLKVALTPKGETAVQLSAHLDIKPFVLQPRRDFPVTHWWHPDAIWDAHKVEPWSEAWWKLARAYVQNMVDHGTNVIYVPATHGRNDMPPVLQQLVKVTTGPQERFSFDFSQVKRFVHLARDCGAEYYEWPHLFMGWGAGQAYPVYGESAAGRVELWPKDTPPTEGIYRVYLSQYLPALKQFLDDEKILDRSFFHLSDEPGGDEHFRNYSKARAMLRELAPWMKVMDALSEVRYGKEKITDIPVPIINTAHEYLSAGIPHWVYYCCGPRGKHINRFMDTPLPAIRMSGWLFYRLGAQGFLHWGYDYWRDFGDAKKMVDPFTEGDGRQWPGIPYGDCFVVYPGKDGPIDSIRWEVFAESLQDYAVLQTAGIRPDDPMLSELKGYADYPLSESWINTALERAMAKPQ